MMEAAMKDHAKPVIIYHLEGRRSIMVVWLCEELGIPYDLKFKPNDIQASVKMMRDANRLMPMFPTVIVDGHLLVETGGILQLLLSKYGAGRLQPPADSDDFPYYLQWLHFAEGTGMYRQWAARFAAMVAGIPIEEVPQGFRAGTEPTDLSSMLVGVAATLAFMDDFLSTHPYFGGKEFSAADIMMHWVAKSAGLTGGVDSWAYQHIAEWRKKIETRPAFLRAMKASVPQGYNEWGLPIDWPLPFVGPMAPPLRAQTK
jgi:glutathione S-transferase